LNPCETLWEWSIDCDISNQLTMTVEIIIASMLAILAISIAYVFYNKEKSRSDESEKLLKSAKNTIDEMKPIIERQGKEIERNHKKNELRKLHCLEKISFSLTLAKRDFFLTKTIFDTEYDLSKAAAKLKQFVRSSKHNANQIEISLKEIEDLLTINEIKKIEFVLGQIKVYNDTIRIISEINYQELREHFPLDKFIEQSSELLKDLPDPHLEV
jgi:hypothetical protein